MRHYSFKPRWTFSLGFAVLLSLFLSLGFWQLRRAAEKDALAALRVQRGRDVPVLLGTGASTVEDLRYRPVIAEGEYDAAHQFLLDNRVHDQQPGYQVLTPLRLANGRAAVMVNRGWVPLGADRSELPDLRSSKTRVRLTGVADRFPAVGLRLQGAEIPAPGWPSVVQLAVPERLAERLGYPVLPYQVLLDETAPDGYVRSWKEVRLSPEKNRGYALQWFLFAAVAAFLYLRHGFKAGAGAKS